MLKSVYLSPYEFKGHKIRLALSALPPLLLAIGRPPAPPLLGPPPPHTHTRLPPCRTSLPPPPITHTVRWQHIPEVDENLRMSDQSGFE